MQPPAIPENEAARLEALSSYRVVDTPPETPFDDLARLAAHVMGTPIALVSLVDADRQWFKARYGLDAPETPREVSFCGHVVADEAALVVADAHADPRFADNPLVTGDPRVRFYAGIPLRGSDGYVLGSLCAIDHAPRAPSAERLELLRALARQVMSQLALRREVIVRRRLAAIVDATPDFVGITDLAGNVLFLNPAARRTLGLCDDESLPSDPARLHPDWALRVVREEAIPTALREGSWMGETALLSPERGEIPTLQLILAREDGPDGGYLATHARDISEIKRVEALKDEFLAMASHELRTPLTSILGSLRLLEGGAMGELGEDAREGVLIARESSERLLYLVNDLLDLQTVDAGKLSLAPERLQPAQLVERAVAGIRTLADAAGIQLAASIESDAPLDADPVRLLQVLTNLLGNAIKFSPAGGAVGIAVSRRGERVRFAVRDQGCGIAPEQQGRLFERFEQLEAGRAQAKGTGLGLAISKAIVEQHGGTIGVESAVGAGSTFWFELPRAGDEKPEPDAA